MPKFDVKKEWKHLYFPSAKQPSMVEVPDMNFLMIDGQGDPNTSQDYQDAMMALYGVSFTVKFIVKGEEPERDYVVPPLEGLWWMDDMTQFSEENKHLWKWTAMIMQPDWVSKEMIEAAIEEVRRKKNPPALDKLRFETYHEGLSAQIMHIGPYSGERPTILKLHDFIENEGYDRRGKHHEIYLSDPRRTAPEKLRTVIRQPVEKKS
ncbi:GyrI-like domain-containing protein [bacterium]|nr:GyrI-like domain-containing protein [FCB group bacterium]MBL7191578.1 GyrI-like domain-containing protein [bacterium]